MKILIVCRSFYPVNSPRAFRANELVKEFVRNGHNVTVYCGDTNKSREPFVSKYKFRLYEYRQLNNIFEGRSNVVARVLNRICNDIFEYPDSFIIKTLSKAIRNENGYDLLISIAVPHPIHWALGLMYNRGFKPARTWVADCGDPYMFVESSSHKHMFYFKYIEKLWCKKCDYITVPTVNAQSGYYPEFHDKIRVIPQAFDFSEVLLRKYVPNSVPTFAFSGSLIPNKRDIRPILKQLSEMNIDFRFHVFTQQRSMVEKFIGILGDKLQIHEYCPRLELIEFLSGMDFLLNIENSGVTNQTPSKLIDYSLTKRPILSIDSNNIDSVKLFEFLNGNYKSQYKIENIEEYNIKNVANAFLNLIK